MWNYHNLGVNLKKKRGVSREERRINRYNKYC